MSVLQEKTKSRFRTLVTEIRVMLIERLEEAVVQRYSLGAKDRSKLTLSYGDQRDYERLQAWLTDGARPHKEADANLRDLIKERAYTLTNRLVILMQLECRGLRKVPLISRGVDNSPFRRDQEFFVDICGGDDMGFRFILQQVWDQLALELPALFTYDEIHECLPVPGPVLLELIEKLNNEELREAWTDDTTLGWLYQYWNDPDRKAVDAKLNNTSGKVEAHELSDKTQLFTERYMVEWLVQNSLGAQWLAICEKNGWQPEALGLIDSLEETRRAWDKPDEAMPVQGKEEFWKFYVAQKLATETVKAAPACLQDVKVLDPAMGSGHFLVYVFDFLHELYLDQARLLNESYDSAQIVSWILENNLHGIDIDNRAVQIGAAALYIKAQEMVPGYSIGRLNLVASDLGLGHLEKDDPAVTGFTSSLEQELGIHKEVSFEIIQSLKGAEYMGSLLQVEKEIDRIVKSFRAYNQALGISEVRQKIMEAIETFIHHHDKGEDLGLKSLAEQMGKGLRLIELLGQKYDVIVANPPYLATTKMTAVMQDGIQKLHLEGDNELYTLFISNSLRLLKENGHTAVVTIRNWMYLSQFEAFRKYILRNHSITNVAELGVSAFVDLASSMHVIVAMFVIKKQYIKYENIQLIRTIPHSENVRDSNQYRKYITNITNQNTRFDFTQTRFAEIPGSPMIYWWPEEFRQAYLKADKLGEVGEIGIGFNSGNNDRFIRNYWEVNRNNISLIESNSFEKLNLKLKWQPYIKGSKGKHWFESLEHVVNWKNNAHEKWVDYNIRRLGGAQNPHRDPGFFKQGSSYSYIGTNGFQLRLRHYKSIFDISGSTIFTKDSQRTQVILSSKISGYISQSINPTINNQSGDIKKLSILNFINDYSIYLDKIEALYNKVFSSTETNIEYTYNHLSSEYFEVEEARIRDEIDKELMGSFSEDTRRAIYREIGESVFDFELWNGEKSSIPDDFAEAYQAESSILELSRKFRMHPDSLLKIKDKLGLIHEGQRRDKAFKDLSWAVGVLLGRFDAQTGGLVDLADERRAEQGLEADPSAPQAHDHGLLYLTALDDLEGLDRVRDLNIGRSALESLKKILIYKWKKEEAEIRWNEIDKALVLDCRTNWSAAQKSKKTLNDWIRTKAFAMHESLYQKRPIYFPLVSKKKNFFVWVNIHKWTDSTLNAVLANYLNPDLAVLEARISRLREEIQSIDDNRTRNQYEKEVAELDKLKEELAEFTGLVTRLATKGPAPDLTELECPYVMDLDDGVMVNSSALWELVLPLWKEPKKWWVSLSKPAGKKDFDWSHLAMRYWPERVMEKVKKDPSLAVAHSDYGDFVGRDLFEELHPEAARKWEEQQTGKKAARGGELDFG